MNLLFGQTNFTLTNDDKFKEVSRKWIDLFPGKFYEMRPANKIFHFGLISDGGRIIGRAKNENGVLIYIGSFHLPFSNRKIQVHADRPDRIAAALLEKYQKEGISFLNNIHGHYCISIYDNTDESALLCCGPSGFYRLFFTQKNGELFFSSKLSAITDLVEDELPLDRTLEDFLLSYSFLPSGKTIFKDVEVVPDSSIIQWNKNGRQINLICQNDPWQGKFDDIELNETNLINRLYDAFMTALEDQSKSSYCTPVILGGFDSALVASGLQRLGKKVDTFSFYFENKKYNQSNTDILSQFLNIKHHWVPININTIKNGLSKFALKFNQVSAHPHYLLQTEFLCSEIRKHGYMNLYSGDGCDGIFMGYPKVHFVANVLNKFGSFSPELTKRVLSVLSWSVFERYFGHFHRIVRNHVRIFSRKMPERGFITSRILDEISLNRLRNGKRPGHGEDVENILRLLAKPFSGYSPNRLAYQGRAMPGVNKNKIEGSTENSGTTIHSPYLHSGMISLTKKIPELYFRPAKKSISTPMGKYIIMQMALQKKLLPNEVIYQKKESPVDAPIDKWYSGPLKHFIFDQLKYLPFESNRTYIQELIRPKLFEEIYRSFFTMDHYAMHAISVLFTYSNFIKMTQKYRI